MIVPDGTIAHDNERTNWESGTACNKEGKSMTMDVAYVYKERDYYPLVTKVSPE
jgi:hypothetical protein